MGLEFAPGVRADRYVAGHAKLSAAPRQGCAGARGDEGAFSAVSALWLPLYPRVSAPAGLGAELV